jgi:hypothetical protein
VTGRFAVRTYPAPRTAWRLLSSGCPGRGSPPHAEQWKAFDQDFPSGAAVTLTSACYAGVTAISIFRPRWLFSNPVALEQHPGAPSSGPDPVRDLVQQWTGELFVLSNAYQLDTS